MNKLIVANWKANPKTFNEALRLAKASDFKNVIITPPYIYLQSLSRVLKKAALGAQDTFWENIGPYTGEITPVQLKNLKIKYVIIGHSKRRELGETDEMINKKVKAALRAGLKVILCVGEDWSTRRKGVAAAKKFVATQIKKDLQLITKKLIVSNLIVAYEPLWAVGTGKADTPEDSTEMISSIKKTINVKVLYGGSVNTKNAAAFLSQKKIDGALVGRISLSPQSFQAIIKTRDSL